MSNHNFKRLDSVCIGMPKEINMAGAKWISFARKTLMLVVATLLLSGCGGNSGGTGGTSSRNVNDTTTTADLSNDACREARTATQDQPLEAYVAALTTLADSGKACAQYGLGALYRTGYGNIEADAAQSQRYLNLAAAQEHIGAKRLLEKSWD